MDQLALVALQFDGFPLADVWGSAVGFITLMVLAVGAIGLGSKNLSVGAMGAYLTFVYYSVTVGIELLENIAYVTITLVILGAVFKMWRLEGFETGS